jgi:hypothetical protein
MKKTKAELRLNDGFEFPGEGYAAQGCADPGASYAPMAATGRLLRKLFAAENRKRYFS